MSNRDKEYFMEMPKGGFVLKTAAEIEAERLNRKLLVIEEALKKVAAPYDGEDGRLPVPLVDIGKELRSRQKIAREALEKLKC